MKTAVLFLAHFMEESVILKYEKLRRELVPEYDLFWVFLADNGTDYQRL